MVSTVRTRRLPLRFARKTRYKLLQQDKQGFWIAERIEETRYTVKVMRLRYGSRTWMVEIQLPEQAKYYLYLEKIGHLIRRRFGPKAADERADMVLELYRALRKQGIPVQEAFNLLLRPDFFRPRSAIRFYHLFCALCSN